MVFCGIVPLYLVKKHILQVLSNKFVKYETIRKIMEVGLRVNPHPLIIKGKSSSINKIKKFEKVK